MYTIQYFIDFFSAIPEDQWTVNTQQNNLGQKCAFGHCNPAFNPHIKDMDQTWALGKLKFPHPAPNHATELYRALGIKYGDRYLLEIHVINNGDHPMFQQETPKQRVLAALEWLKEQEANKVITEALAKKDSTPIPSIVEC